MIANSFLQLPFNCFLLVRIVSGGYGGDVVYVGEAGAVYTGLEVIIEYSVVTPTPALSSQMAPGTRTPAQREGDDSALPREEHN